MLISILRYSNQYNERPCKIDYVVNAVCLMLPALYLNENIMSIYIINNYENFFYISIYYTHNEYQKHNIMDILICPDYIR